MKNFMGTIIKKLKASFCLSYGILAFILFLAGGIAFFLLCFSSFLMLIGCNPSNLKNFHDKKPVFSKKTHSSTSTKTFTPSKELKTIKANTTSRTNNSNELKRQEIIKVLEVRKQPFSNTLYFSGKIQPLSLIPIVSPVDGVVNNIFFTYGEYIKENQKLFSITSPREQQAFRETLTRYLKAKQDVNLTEAKMKSSEDLYKQGIVSRDEETEAKRNYSLNKLAFLQEKENLETRLKYHPNIDSLSNISITDTDIISKILSISAQTEDIIIFSSEALFSKSSGSEQLSFNQSSSSKIPFSEPLDKPFSKPVSEPASKRDSKPFKQGVALFPDGREDRNKLQVGSEVKAGQILVYIGDMDGITIKIEINENNINQLRIGQEAIVTGNAFPNIKLIGYITNIDAQATSDQGSPIFTAVVTVSDLMRLPEEQRKTIRVGMDTKIAITFRDNPHILVPIKAVIREDGQNKVKILALTNSIPQLKEVNVMVGETTEDSIAITSGLNIGDKVVISN